MAASMAASTAWRKVETLVVAKVVTMEKKVEKMAGLKVV